MRPTVVKNGADHNKVVKLKSNAHIDFHYLNTEQIDWLIRTKIANIINRSITKNYSHVFDCSEIITVVNKVCMSIPRELMIIATMDGFYLLIEYLKCMISSYGEIDNDRIEMIMADSRDEIFNELNEILYIEK